MLSPALLLLLASAMATDPDYCNIQSCDAVAEHTMCVYTSEAAAVSCGSVTERGVTADDQTEILAAHNTIRQQVKEGKYAAVNLPAALAMPDLTWDAELAAVAQRWTDQCVSGHDKCNDVPRFSVGQNFAASWGYAKNWTTHAVGKWFFKELPLFLQQDLTFVSGTGTGHLTQLIWANTTVVGCGFIAVEDAQIFPGYTLIKRTYICNYGPAGNFLDQQIYTAA